MSHESSTTGPRLPDGTLLEGIVTTLNDDGSPHIAPMGPIVDAEFTQLLLRPFRTSTTYQNLKRTGQGVLHVTDDVELFARAAVGQLASTAAIVAGEGDRRRDPGRCLPLVRISRRVARRSRRANAIVARVVEYGRLRDFFGFNRAKHAVIEAAILATRIDLLDAGHIRDEFERLAVLVDKTGGHQEHAAFAVLAGSTCANRLCARRPARRRRDR